MAKKINLVFAILPNVHLIDLAGPVQVFFEANQFGANYTINYCGIDRGNTVPSQQGLQFTGLVDFRDIQLDSGDYLFIPGIEFSSIKSGQLRSGFAEFNKWLKELNERGVNLCTVCSGTFVLASSGLLRGRSCTTHWKCIDYLGDQFSQVTVLDDQLYVKDGNIYTSAGMTSGIDMALSIVDEHHGPVLTAKVAREMVVYLRRSGTQKQESIYLDFRTHIHPAIHKIQDYLIQHPSSTKTMPELASLVNMSERNLTRLFRRHTGITIQEFKTRCRLEHAKTLLQQPEYTIDYIAAQCGFKDGRQLRRLWKEFFGHSPRERRPDTVSLHA